MSNPPESGDIVAQIAAKIGDRGALIAGLIIVIIICLCNIKTEWIAGIGFLIVLIYTIYLLHRIVAPVLESAVIAAQTHHEEEGE
jgi:predicted ferric reductase